jgi:hypothetical protein
MSTLLKDCKAGLQEELDFFQVSNLIGMHRVYSDSVAKIKGVNLMKDIADMHEESQKRHQEVLSMIEALSDTSSDQASSA